MLTAFHLTPDSAHYLSPPSTPFPHCFLLLLSFHFQFDFGCLGVFFLCLCISNLLLPITQFLLLLSILPFLPSFLITVWLAGASEEEGGCLGLRYCFACPRQSSPLPTNRLCTLMHYSLSLVHSFTYACHSYFRSYALPMQ